LNCGGNLDKRVARRYFKGYHEHPQDKIIAMYLIANLNKSQVQPEM
jgi:hypothetical protein